MKITANNLRSVGSAKTVDVNDKIVLCGINGAGKSTIAKTPYFVLTGKGLSLKNGETEGMGSIEFAGISISRQKKNGNTTIRVNGKVCSEVAMYEHLNKIGYNPDVLCSLFDTETVLDGETMLKVASMQLDVDKILSFTKLEGDMLKLVKQYFQTENIDIITIPAINKAYKKFYTARTDNNRVIKSLRVLVETDMQYDNIDIPDVALLVSKSTGIEESIEKMMAEVFAIEQDAKTLASITGANQTYSSEIEKLKQVVCQYSEKDIENITKEIDDKHNAENECDKQLKNLNNTHLALLHDLSDANTKRQIVVENGKGKKEIFETLSTTTTCPLYAGLPCTTNMDEVKAKLQAEISSLREECKSIDEKIAKIKERIASTEEEIKKVSDEKDTLRREVSSLVKKRGEMEKERTAFASIEGRISAIERNIAENNEKMKTIVVKDATAIKNKMAQKRLELNAIKQRIVDASKVVDAVKRLEENEKKLEEAEKITSMYSVILQELNVLPNKIFEKIITPIEAGLNQILAEIKNDWKIKFLFDGANLDVCIITPLGEININEVSTGERVVINYAFKSLICKLIGFDTIVLDNTDALDVINYNMVEDVVAKSPYNTLLINCGDIKSKFAIINL